MDEVREVRLPKAWIGAAVAVAVLAWIPVLLIGDRSTGWLGLTVGIATGCMLFVIGAWSQRVRLEGTRLSGNRLLRRSVDLSALATMRVGGNPMPGGARSNEVAMLEDALGGRVTIPLRNFPSDRRRRIVELLRGPVLASDAEVDEATLALFGVSPPES
jgi:hypothetical protein